jgi:hypothetical protein
MRIRWTLSCVCLLAVITGYCQSNPGSVTLRADPKLGALVRKQIEYNMGVLSHQRGFRVEVMITPSRSKAEEVKVQMLKQFPQYRTYLLYQDPYFKIRVGDFKNREDAAPLQDQISKLYMEGVFTVPDLINVSPEIPNDNNQAN